MYSHHADSLFKPLGPRNGFPERRTPTYDSVYDSQLEYWIKNTSCLLALLGIKVAIHFHLTVCDCTNDLQQICSLITTF